MATSQSRRGRPSLGDRHAFRSVMPRAVAEVVFAEALARGLSHSEYIALVVAKHLSFQVKIPPRQSSIPEPFELPRPHSGDRHIFKARIPRAVAEVVFAEALARGLSHSEYIALVVAKHLSFQVKIPPRRRPVPEQPDLGIGA